MKRRTFLQGAAAAALLGPRSAAPALAQATSKTTLKFVPQANLSALDPIWTTATVTNNHGYHVFDTLYGADMELKPQPQMVEGHEVLDGGKAWRIKLREGLVFHDGQPVRAADCVASLKRFCQRDSYGQLLARVVESWTALDDRTFEIKLKRAFPTLLDVLAKVDTPCFIMPERLAVTDATKQVTEMVGSGPYRFLAGEYVSGSKMAYEKFAGYKPRPEPASRNAGGKQAHFDRIEWQILPDPATAANRADQGRGRLVGAPARRSPSAAGRQPRCGARGHGPVRPARHHAAEPPASALQQSEGARGRAHGREAGRLHERHPGRRHDALADLPQPVAEGTPYYTGEQEDLMPQSLDKAKAALKESGYQAKRSSSSTRPTSPISARSARSPPTC